MSDALLSGSQAAGPKLAAVWQPAPVLKALANQRFVRVKDARGHTSHFTLSSYQHLEQAATSKVQEAAKAAPTEGASAPISRPDNLDLPDSDLAELANEPLRIIKKREYAKGLSEGRRLTLEKLKKQEEEKATEAKGQQSQNISSLLEKIAAQLSDLQADPASRLEPVKRLALHLAEQLVLAELTLSPQAIQNLMSRCVEMLDQSVSKPIQFELNPDDLTLLQSAQPTEQQMNWQLVANPDLLPGSVRLISEDVVISDLIENRLNGLASSLLKAPQQWQANSAFSPKNLQLRKNNDQVQDVLANPQYERFQAPARATEPSSSTDAETELMPMPSPEPQTSDRPQFMNEVLLAPDAAPMPAFDFPLSQDDLSLGQAATPEEANPKAEGQPHDD